MIDRNEYNMDFLRALGKLNENTIVEIRGVMGYFHFYYPGWAVAYTICRIGTWITWMGCVSWRLAMGDITSAFIFLLYIPTSLIFMASLRAEPHSNKCLGRIIIDYARRIGGGDFTLFLNKFCRSYVNRSYGFILILLTLGKVRGFTSSWNVDYGLFVTAIQLCQSNPEIFDEIVGLAKNKKEFRQMMAVR